MYVCVVYHIPKMCHAARQSIVRLLKLSAFAFCSILGFESAFRLQTRYYSGQATSAARS